MENKAQGNNKTSSDRNTTETARVDAKGAKPEGEDAKAPSERTRQREGEGDGGKKQSREGTGKRG